MKNYRKLAVKKTLLIYIYTNPLIYLFLLIITKIIIQTKNNFLTVFICGVLETNSCLSPLSVV